MSETKILETDVDRLVPGKRYRVSYSDCCAEGWFEAVFREVIRYEDGEPETLVFDHARVEIRWGSTALEEIP